MLHYNCKKFMCVCVYLTTHNEAGNNDLNFFTLFLKLKWGTIGFLHKTEMSLRRVLNWHKTVLLSHP